MINSPYVCLSCKKPIPFAVTYCPICGQRQRSGTAPLWLGERRLVTILFADLASFTATSEKIDPEDVIDMLNQVFTRLMVHCDQEGGYLDKIVGDQLMVLFGAPRTHEDDPVRAVRAALAMQATMKELAPIMKEKVGAACKLNMGINTGIVMWGRVGPMGRAAPTVIGDAVNLACRLEQFATAGQIVVSDPVYFLTRRFFEYEILEPINVKGKSRAVPVYVPLRPRQSLRSHKQSTEIKTPFIEREQECQALHDHWSQAISGHSQLALLRSAAGLGKSRLLAEFMQGLDKHLVDKQPLVLHAHSEAALDGYYSPLTNLLAQLFTLAPDDSDLVRRRKVQDRALILSITNRRFLPLMGYLLGWYQDDVRLGNAESELDLLRASAFDTAAALFFKQATHRPTLLIIDDLQWADSNSLQWLNRLVVIKETMQRDYVGHRLMVVVASRPQTEISFGALQADSLISLSPLSEPARRELISHLLPGSTLPSSLVERLSEESGGNPFYLEEAAQGLVQSGQLVQQHGLWKLTRSVEEIVVPPSVEGLVMANMDLLSQTARIVLQHASVIGKTFGYGLLSAITPLDSIEQTLAELVEHGFIKEIGNNDISRSFSFVQIMVREVAYRSLLRKTRRDLHAQIARLTEEETSDNVVQVEKLARHYAAGGDEEKKIAYNWLAGRHALDNFAFEDAYHRLELVWNVLQKMSEPNLEIYRNVANALGDASTFTHNFTQAITCYQTLRGLIGDTPGEQAILHYKLGRLHFYQANMAAACQNYRQAQALAADNPALMAQIDAEMRLLYDLS